MPASSSADHAIATLGGRSMGTTWSVKLIAPRGRDLHPLHACIQAALDRVVAQMSTWEADSDISRYNRAAAGQWQTLPDEFHAVLSAALQIAQASDGAFDPTVGPMVELWGFGASGGRRQVPAADQIALASARCGWQRVQLDGMRVRQPGALALDLSGIAKGFGVDCVHRALLRADIDSALIEVGGELFGYGRKPDGSAWRVLVESAPDEDAGAALPARVLALDGLAVATSGDRWHRFDADGTRYAHTFDPCTGAPVPHAPAAVTVLARNAMQADAWATAMTVLGADAGLAYARTAALAVRFLTRKDGVLLESMSPAFEQQLAAS
ncbi:FAD:protein FMN transferase [Xanthomonas hortorum]|uniref:FAD:protein FMN transferase n=1 Tax=Xanthomonas hortorum pv. gardneri TaxID=2754056 RepID=A0A6V7CJ19_9XANT|nr:FAD:protein FMN transferase [Xanthomonas hortorum]MCC4626689.1 FAD:protein FMN transferase [Xanthomonas campestris pv. nigromaculans]APP81427.1 thiamine biosynthesis protein ApbE [Xanthomonas hortorum pv. gardneri]EGD18983.1 membrane-associated lipoprotein involved in thiamine biosynthesis [Xanthomonas hortorum ATCC 19865]KLA93420.1 thiamine biosynthesis protein ApbE [Xanthomonas hortorum pv. gardneri]KLA97314.1 thiamine biosynthesis protein ApbE [Xanthomonas hortorum pv. gardneri]